MNNLEICIWGVRVGYQIVYSENKSYSEFLHRNTKEFDRHYQRLSEDYKKPFFFIQKFNEKQVFSYVTNENIDFGDARPSFMVISILSPSNLSFGSNLAKELVLIWQLYAQANISAEGHYPENRFKPEDLRAGLNNLNPTFSPYAYELNDRVIEVDQFDDEFGTIFGMAKCRGEQIYFLQTPIPNGVLNRLPAQRTPIKELIKGSNKEQEEINRLKQLISNKQSFQEASQLYQQWGNKLDEKVRQLFLAWKSAQEPKVNPLHVLLSLQRPLTKDELNELITAKSKESSDYRALSESQKTKLDGLTAVEPERPKNEPKTEPKTPLTFETTKESVRAEIKEAKNNAWKNSPFPLELKLKNNPTLRASLDASDVDDLRLWNEHFDAFENSECLELITTYYQKITKASNSEKRTNQSAWISEVDTLKNRVLSLANKENRAFIESSNKYEYLINKKWVLRNHKPLLIKLTISLCVIGVFIAGYYELMNHKNTISGLTTDTDKDGLYDSLDTEDNTPWITDTSYHLSKYIDASGKVDTNKTKPLCDCWKFPEIKDREILKCQENSTWFVVDKKLYQFKEDDYYKSEGVRMSASDDDAVEEDHRKRFSTAHEQNNPNTLTTFTYKNQKYQIKQGFLSEDGMIFNGARWRYYQNTWKKSDDNSDPYDNWMATNQADIDYLLSKIATKISTGNGNGTGNGTGNGNGNGTGQTDKKDTAGADDQYWIELVPTRNSLSGKNLCEAKANLLIKKSLSKAGQAAYTKVYNAIKDKNCSY
jgi:hypothetical protein